MFKDAIENILVDHCTTAVTRSIENGGPATQLWQSLAESGFLELMADESAGGANLDLAEVFPIFVTLGRHALPVPLAQTIASRVLLPQGVAEGLGMVTLAGHGRRDDGSVAAVNVAFGAIADHVLVGLDGKLLLLNASRAERRATGVRGSLVALLRWPQEAVTDAVVGDNGAHVAIFSAAIHATAIAGAMERLFAMALDYCNDRVQFGKPIGKFQSVQHQLSVMAEHVACAGVAAELAFPARSRIPALLRTATAKARTSASVTPVAATAHALHGAIGVTEEFDLQLFSRRLHEWRMADGSEVYWNKIVGDALLKQPTQTVLDFIKETAL